MPEGDAALPVSGQAPSDRWLVEIYSDGACSGNPGPGGWAAILIAGGKEREIAGYEESTTNNRMEMTAAIEALKRLKKPCSVRIYSDSSYLVSAFTKNWLANWKRNGWKNASKDPVSNQELWAELDRLASIHNMEWIKVAGHSNNEKNNRCDLLAVSQIKERRTGKSRGETDVAE